MKSLVFIAAALVVDVLARSRPWRALLVTLAFTLTSWSTSLLKDAVGRERPSGDNLVDLPASKSFPSGHASTAFAAAVALSLLAPRMAWWALPLAAAVTYSRVYLGVHYWTDILAGAVLGTVVAVVVVRGALNVAARRRAASGGA